MGPQQNEKPCVMWHSESATGVRVGIRCSRTGEKKYQESLGGRNVVVELSMLAASVLACVFNAER